MEIQESSSQEMRMNRIILLAKDRGTGPITGGIRNLMGFVSHHEVAQLLGRRYGRRAHVELSPHILKN
jgi:hypothetical protein